VIVDRPIALVGAGTGRTIIEAMGLPNGINVDGFDHAGLSHVIIRGFTYRTRTIRGSS
jgi:hypothetical protein